MARITRKISELTGDNERQKKLKEQFSFLQNIANSKCNEFREELEKMFVGEMDKCEAVGKRAIVHYHEEHIEHEKDKKDSFIKEKTDLKK